MSPPQAKNFEDWYHFIPGSAISFIKTQLPGKIISQIKKILKPSLIITTSLSFGCYDFNKNFDLKNSVSQLKSFSEH